MFSELPNLFERNFAMAFLLPFIVFLWLAVEILSLFGLSSNLISLLQVDLAVRTVIVFLVAWLGGIFLLATNNGLYRFLEGYGGGNPLKLFKSIEEKRFEHLTRRISELNDKFKKALEGTGTITPEEIEERTDCMLEYPKRFPHKAKYLLPTPFGNTIRAFEVYSTVMYGLEAIDGWSRLLAVIPKDYRELIDNAKTDVDFWVNIGCLSILLSLEYISLAVYFASMPVWWLPVILFIAAVMAPRFARSSVVAWGDYIKAAFDVFRPKLREALLFQRPADRQEEENQWTGFSQAIVFRVPDAMPPLKDKGSAGAPCGLPDIPIIPAPEPVVPRMRFCSNCGREVQPGGRFCSTCGYQVAGEAGSQVSQ